MKAERWRRVPARIRITAAAVAVSALTMGVAAAILVVLMRRALVDEVETSARLRAGEISAALAAGEDPPLVVAERDEQFVQIVDREGSVLAASENIRGVAAVISAPDRTRRLHLPIDEDPFLAVSSRAPIGLGSPALTVVVGRALSDAHDTANMLARLLAGGVPLLLAAIGAITWTVVGRALHPVDAMRREVDGISAAELHRRVARPPADDEIGRLAETMNRMLDRLEEAQIRQRRFVGDAAHELRSPIAAIRQHAEVALAHPERSSIIGLADAVRAEDLRLQQLVEDLLVAAHADAETLAARLAREPVDLDDVVFAEARRLRETTALQVDTTAVSAGRVTGDAAALRRVVRNLADNAARHARRQLRFGLGAADGLVTLTVDDDGPGIAEPDRERVFGRFVRLDDARSRDAGGSGLGLSIVADLVTAHGGTVAISESPARGARVTVDLPAGD